MVWKTGYHKNLKICSLSENALPKDFCDTLVHIFNKIVDYFLDNPFELSTDWWDNIDPKIYTVQEMCLFL